jgi:hypothetical protein
MSVVVRMRKPAAAVEEGRKRICLLGYSRMKSVEERRGPGYDEKKWAWPNSALFWGCMPKSVVGIVICPKLHFFY